MKRPVMLVWAAAGWTLFIPLLSLLPPAFFSAAGNLARFPGADKVVHAVLYGVHAFLLMALSRACRRAIPLWSIMLLSGLYGLMMELMQYVVTSAGRLFSWGDIAANCAGAFVALLLFRLAFPLRLSPPFRAACFSDSPSSSKQVALQGDERY